MEVVFPTWVSDISYEPLTNFSRDSKKNMQNTEL